MESLKPWKGPQIGASTPDKGLEREGCTESARRVQDRREGQAGPEATKAAQRRLCL